MSCIGSDPANFVTDLVANNAGNTNVDFLQEGLLGLGNGAHVHADFASTRINGRKLLAVPAVWQH